MKKIRYLTAAVMGLCLMLISACGSGVGTAEISIDYGESAIYSRGDMDAAIERIQDEFAGWKGCELHSIRYTSDACNTQENIQWMNELVTGRDSDGRYTQCIAFASDFHSPRDAENQGAWNLDEEYKDWQWWLARTDEGEWQLMTWGYA